MQIVTPAHLTSAVVERAQDAAPVHRVIGPGPTVRAVRLLEKVDAIGVVCAHQQQSGRGIEARRSVVGAAGLVGRHEASIGRRFLGRIGPRPAGLVDAAGPVDGGKGRREQVLAVGPVEHEVVAVARRLQQQPARHASELGVDQHRHFGGVPVVRVVRRRLEAPGQRAGVGIERDDGAGPAVVAGPHLAVEHRGRVAGADVEQIELRIVGAGHPHLAAGGAAADRTWRAGGRRAVERPLRRARVGVERAQDARQVVEIARDADDEMVADEERRVRGPVPLLRVGDHHVPLHRAVARVEGDQVGVWRGEEHQVPGHRGAAVADVEAVVRRIGVAPDLAPVARVDRPQVVGGGDVDHAVGHDRRGFDLLRLSGLERPRERELADVVGRDLRQAAVMTARVVAVVGEPAVGGRLQQRRRIDALRRGRHAEQENGAERSEHVGRGFSRATGESAGRPAHHACPHRCISPAARRAPAADRPRCS